MLQGDKCGVWQHSLCVGINVQEPPDHFFCEWCRVSLADPFWEPRQRAFFPAASMRPTKGQPPAYLTPGEQVQRYGYIALSPPATVSASLHEGQQPAYPTPILWLGCSRAHHCNFVQL